MIEKEVWIFPKGGEKQGAVNWSSLFCIIWKIDNNMGGEVSFFCFFQITHNDPSYFLFIEPINKKFEQYFSLIWIVFIYTKKLDFKVKKLSN